MPVDDPAPDMLVVGGGIVGLTVAYRLASEGLRVTLVERGAVGREASWAGAGVIPPGSWYGDHPDLDRLAVAASEEQRRQSIELRALTGLDDEYSRCGAEYHVTAENAAYVRDALTRWRALGIAVEALNSPAERWFVASEAQVRNPRRLHALRAGCEARGVAVVENAAVYGFGVASPGVLASVRTARGEFPGGAVCLCAGAWTPGLADSLGLVVPGRPVRGQMLALRHRPGALSRVVHRYPFYAVPRRDGVVLVGATVEEAGFDRGTTASARRQLLAAAAEIDPALAKAEVLAHWSGLRPASGDGLPLIGRAPGWENVWLATGHHRAGLQLAPVTATILSRLVRAAPCDLPSAPWDPARFGSGREVVVAP